MPNAVSNHFAITALQEGVTVQGSLRVNGALSQNYNSVSGNCVPDWKNTPSLQPVIYPVIRKGTTYMANTQLVNTQWLYNDVPIVFDAANKSSNFTDGATPTPNPLFQCGTMSVNLGGTNYNVPYLKIISNLASANNIDLDTIGFTGSVEIAGKQSSFACQVDVKIAQMTSQGYLGLLSPESAIITDKNQNVSIEASLYGDDGSSVSTFYLKWFNAGTGAEISSARNQKTLVVNEADVTDNMIVRCDFYTDSGFTNRVTTAFASIDDTQDPEYLYISLDNANNDFSGQLSPGESCIVTAWMATMEDSTAINTQYTNFTVKLYDGDQNEITSASGAPVMTTASNKGTMTIPYNFVAAHGFKIMGIVTAS